MNTDSIYAKVISALIQIIALFLLGFTFPVMRIAEIIRARLEIRRAIPGHIYADAAKLSTCTDVVCAKIPIIA